MKLPYPHPKTWNQRIRNAEVTGSFTINECALAQGWMSCAIGERFHVKKHGGNVRTALKEEHVPSREVTALEWLGIEFARAVRNDNAEEARHQWSRIQQAWKNYNK